MFLYNPEHLSEEEIEKAEEYLMSEDFLKKMEAIEQNMIEQHEQRLYMRDMSQQNYI